MSIIGQNIHLDKGKNVQVTADEVRHNMGDGYTMKLELRQEGGPTFELILFGTRDQLDTVARKWASTLILPPQPPEGGGA